MSQIEAFTVLGVTASARIRFQAVSKVEGWSASQMMNEALENYFVRCCAARRRKHDAMVRKQQGQK